MTTETAAVNEVVAELKSEFGSMGRAVGALKCINGLELISTAPDIVTKAVSGIVEIRAYHEDPYGGHHDGAHKFEVTLADAWRLSQVAPKFAPCFAEIAGRLQSDLDGAQEADRDAIAGWCDQGLPTAQATSVMKPLKWKF